MYSSADERAMTDQRRRRMPDGNISVDKLFLVEYERIKDEQRTRIGFRDNLVYATLASIAAVIAATINAHGQANLLLLIPPVCVLLGWTYLVNDEKVSAAGQYIRTELVPRLSTLVPDGTAVFAWESFHRSDPRRRARKVLQLVVDLSMFCVAPVAALVVFWITGTQIVTLLVVSLAEVVIVAALAAHIVLYSDLSEH
jgi:hypothetical protein